MLAIYMTGDEVSPFCSRTTRAIQTADSIV